MCGWYELKNRLLSDHELSPEDWVSLRAADRKADGAELASRLDALVNRFRKVQSAFMKARPEARYEAAWCGCEDHRDLLQQARTLLVTWCDVFDCVREAEPWFYETYGPGEDTKRLNLLAEPLDVLYFAIEQLRAWPTQWESLDDLKDEIDESLKKLHRQARELQSPKASGGSKSGKARRPGRKPLPESECNRRYEILRNWKRAGEAGIARKDFCAEQGITVKDLENYQRWADQRNNRSL